MIEKTLYDINGIPVYIDPLIDSKEILVGRKQGISRPNFVVISKEIYNIFFIEERINDERYEKLRRILNDPEGID